MEQVKGYIEVLFRIPDTALDADTLTWNDYAPVMSSFPITEFDSPLEILEGVYAGNFGVLPRQLREGDILHVCITSDNWVRRRSVVMVVITEAGELKNRLLHPQAIVAMSTTVAGMGLLTLSIQMPFYSEARP